MVKCAFGRFGGSRAVSCYIMAGRLGRSHGARTLIFNHDNCPKHTARLLYREVAKMGKSMSQNFCALRNFLESLDDKLELNSTRGADYYLWSIAHNEEDCMRRAQVTSLLRCHSFQDAGAGGAPKDHTISTASAKSLGQPATLQIARAICRRRRCSCRACRSRGPRRRKCGAQPERLPV